MARRRRGQQPPERRLLAVQAKVAADACALQGQCAGDERRDRRPADDDVRHRRRRPQVHHRRPGALALAVTSAQRNPMRPRCPRCARPACPATRWAGGTTCMARSSCPQRSRSGWPTRRARCWPARDAGPPGRPGLHRLVRHRRATGRPGLQGTGPVGPGHQGHRGGVTGLRPCCWRPADRVVQRWAIGSAPAPTANQRHHDQPPASISRLEGSARRNAQHIGHVGAHGAIAEQIGAVAGDLALVVDVAGVLQARETRRAAIAEQGAATVFRLCIAPLAYRNGKGLPPLLVVVAPTCSPRH